MFNSMTAWICTGKLQRKYNNFLAFRKIFDINNTEKANLEITADARYELHINGHWVGNGPIRSWQSPLPVDSYDIAKYLQKGKNVIAVLVHHYGIGTNQYLLGNAGLIAECKIGSKIISTDRKWKVCSDNAFAMPAPQLSFQQPWEEQFNAKDKLYHPIDWRTVDYDDSKWDNAIETKKEGLRRDKFNKRPIPFLTREKISPKSLVSIETVKPADYIWSLNLRACFEDTGSGDLLYRSVLVHTYIYSPHAQIIEIQDPHELSVWPSVIWKINGKQILGNNSRFDDPIMNWGDSRVVKVKLKKGWNTLFGKHVPTAVIPRAVISIRAAKRLKFSHIPDIKASSDTSWLIIGPFAPSEQERCGLNKSIPDIRYPVNIHPKANSEMLDVIWNRGILKGSERKYPFTQRLSKEAVTHVDVFAISLSDKLAAKTEIKAEDIDSMLFVNSEYSTIYPNKQGDVRLLIDFGRELVGFQEFEIDAPEGTILDFTNFEFIQPDGRKNLCEGMNNSFRYTCRQGYQKYRTALRRGFRYTYLTIRNFKEPVKIYHVGAIFNTYPFSYNGSFACSDEKLNKIWQAGVNTLRCCSEDAYTDCPTYEQAFWVGDGRNEALVDFVVNGDPRLSANSLMLAAHSLQRSDITESHTPSAWKGIIPAWSFLWMRWAQEHYQFTGDDKFSLKLLKFIKKNIEGLKKYINDIGLIKITAWNLFDWAPMDTPPDGIVTHNNCLAVLALNQCAKLAGQLGKKNLADDWENLASSLRKAINRHLWSDTQKAYYDCIHSDGMVSKVFSQQTHVAAYIAKVPAKDRKDRCRTIINKAPNRFVKAGSPFFMFFLLEVLAHENRFEDMANLIRDYWGLQTDAGADTFWEMYTPKANRLTRSHCHGWSSAPTFFLSHYVLGIQPLEPGYKKVLIAPQIAGLSWARGAVPTPHGNIQCRWQIHKDGFEILIELPMPLPLKIEIPVVGKVIIIGKSSATIRKSGGRTWIYSDKEKKMVIKVN